MLRTPRDEAGPRQADEARAQAIPDAAGGGVRGEPLMSRRRIVAGLLLSLAAPLVAEAQQAGKLSRIGVLSPFSRDSSLVGRQSFLQRLHELGWIAGQNLAFEPRYAEGKLDRLPDFAAELVQLKVSVLLAVGTPAAFAAKRATATIPIVMLAADPMGTGLVASLGRPGGNVTGVTSEASLEFAAKRLELLKLAAPKTSRVGVLWDSSNPAGLGARDATQAPARALGLTLLPQDVRMPNDLEGALEALSRVRADALMVTESFANIEQRKVIVSFAEKHWLPTVFGERASVEDGGLMSYGTDPADLFRHAATYIDKILRGAKPGDLPVEQPTKFELVINLKAAKALGLSIPPSLLQRADQVIE
jgi:putative ABC transport system substrate-binding protein